MKFVVVIVAVIGVFAFIRFGGIQATRELLNPTDPYAGLRSDAWSEAHELAGDLAIDLPIQLHRSRGTPPPEAAHWINRQDDYTVEAKNAYLAVNVVTIRPGSPFNLEAGVRGSINDLKRDKEVVEVKEELNPSRFMDHDAINAKVTIETLERGMEYRCLYTIRGNFLYAFTLGMPANTPDIDKIWERITDSIRLKSEPQQENNSFIAVGSGNNSSDPGLPPGVFRKPDIEE